MVQCQCAKRNYQHTRGLKRATAWGGNWSNKIKVAAHDLKLGVGFGLVSISYWFGSLKLSGGGIGKIFL